MVAVVVEVELQYFWICLVAAVVVEVVVMLMAQP